MSSGIQDKSGQHSKTSSLLKIKKIGQAWWQAPVVSAAWVSEVGGSLEPGRWRLQQAVIIPLHSSLGSRGRHCFKKAKKEK